MVTLKVVLLGEFIARVNERPLIAESKKIQELLAYLVLHRDRSHHRSALAQLLWPNHGHGRRYLRQAVWGLRTALRRIDETAYLTAEDDSWIRLAPDIDVWVDVDEIRAVVERNDARRAPSRDEQLREALALYQGDLLSGNDEPWVVLERRNAQALFFEISGELIQRCLAKNDATRARALATRALSFDPVHEATHRLLMRVHLLRGDRTAALRQYETCERLLLREFAVHPENETVRLYQQIQGQPSRKLADDDAGESMPRALVSGLRD